jgi:hypothetical protein
MDPFNTTGCMDATNDASLAGMDFRIFYELSCARMKYLLILDHMFSVDDLDTLMKSPPKKGESKRKLICLEMLQTETNYVQILRTITSVSVTSSLLSIVAN